MTTDPDMKIDYAMVLKQLQAELDGMDERRKALLATIASMSRLVAGEEGQEQAFPPTPDGAVRLPDIPPGFFSGMTTTEGYRELMKLWPGHYTPPQLVTLFIAGGMSNTGRTALLQAVHSVLKRDRDRRANEESKRIGGILPMAGARRR